MSHKLWNCWELQAYVLLNVIVTKTSRMVIISVLSVFVFVAVSALHLCVYKMLLAK